MTEKPLPGGRSAAGARAGLLALVILAYAGLLFGGPWLAARLAGFLAQHGLSPASPVMTGMLVAALGIYIVATALPFVPGAEIGLSLIMLLGVRIVPAVYLATVASLLLAFALGRHVPERRLAGIFAGMGFSRAAALLHGLSGLSEAERIRHLVQSAPSGWLPWLLRHRFWGLALAINLPGNTLLGGGGCIAMLVGIARIMSLAEFTLCVLLAVSPIPLSLILSASLFP